MKSGSLVVKHHSPVQKFLYQLMLLVVIVGGGWGLYSFGQHQAGFDRQQSEKAVEGIKNALQVVERQKADLRDQVALLERGTQMDKQAQQDVSVNIRALQEEVLELREEVTFYRGIVAPNETSSGLRLERFTLERTLGENSLFHYKLVLTQVLKNHKNTRGTVTLKVLGTQNGKPRTLTLKTLSGKKNAWQGFKFRYFQKFEGDMTLPKNFQPRSVEVTVKPKGRKEVKRSFDWVGLLNKDELDAAADAESNKDKKKEATS
jgi:hypothetical protein